MGSLVGLLFGIGLAIAIGQQKIPQFSIARVHSVPADWPQFFDDVASGIRAGLSLPVSTWQAGGRLPDSLAIVFSQYSESWKSSAGFVETLSNLASSINQKPFHYFHEIVALSHHYGGSSIATMLNQASQNLRTQQQLIDEVSARQAVTKNSAKVAVIAPWLVLLMTATRAEVRATFLTATGLEIIAGVFIVCLISYYGMQKIAQIPEMRLVT